MIDLYLKPLLIGADPWDIEFLWQHMYRKTMAFGRKGIGMVAISAVDIALWDLLGKSAKQPVFDCSAAAPSRGFRSTPAASTARRSTSSPREATKYKNEGYKAMKLRFGWGPTDGAAGMQQERRSRAHGARDASATTSTSWPTPTWAGLSTTPSACCRCSSRSTCAGSRSR